MLWLNVRDKTRVDCVNRLAVVLTVTLTVVLTLCAMLLPSFCHTTFLSLDGPLETSFHQLAHPPLAAYPRPRGCARFRNFFAFAAGRKPRHQDAFLRSLGNSLPNPLLLPPPPVDIQGNERVHAAFCERPSNNLQGVAAKKKPSTISAPSRSERWPVGKGAMHMWVLIKEMADRPYWTYVLLTALRCEVGLGTVNVGFKCVCFFRGTGLFKSIPQRSKQLF